MGAKIGKYQVEQRRAIGGQAIVYKCYDALLDRHVAVKQISTHLAEDPKFLERFRKEAQILARLGSEQSAIIAIHELIEEERGLFIVMEFVAGHTLETALEENAGPTDPKAVLQILWRLAAGLHAVHGAGIIHRDIKPSNIIVGEHLRPKITDFGVAASMTGQTSMLLGTTKYMAPELFGGGGGAVDGRADMYSLGFVAYEMLLGRGRFNEIFEDVVRDKHSEALRWMKWHGNTQVEAPAPAQVDPDVPEALSNIVARMIQKNPEDRYENMEALGRAIKMTFSPRARGAAPSPHDTLPGSGEHRPAAGSEAPRTPAGVANGEGDEAPPTVDSVPTAALPKRHLSLRTKLISAGVIVVVMLALAIVLGVRAGAERKRISDRRVKLFDKAETAYIAGVRESSEARLAEAMGVFAEVQRKYPGSAEAAKASVREPLAKAHHAVLVRDWTGAIAEWKAAGARVKKVQGDRNDLKKWIERCSEEIENFESYRTTARQFHEAMEQAAKAFEGKNFDGANEILNRKLRGLALTPGQNARLAEFKARVAVAAIKTEFDALIEAADLLTGKGDLEQAGAKYQEAKDLLEQNRVRKTLKSDEHEAMKLLLSAKRSKLDEESKYREALEAVKKAQSEGNRARLLGALRRMDRIRPSAELTERIKTVQAEILLDQGKNHAAAGRFSEARKFYERSQQVKDTKAVRDALAALDRTEKRQLLIAEGQAAFEAGKYAEAMKSFEQARQIESDDKLAAKLRECGYLLQMAKVQRLFRQEKKYDEALAASEKLRDIDPAKSARIDALQSEIRQTKEYHSHLSIGDAALAKKQWSKALKAFQEARFIRQTPEVEGRIGKLWYEQNLDYGKRAMDNKDYNGALGYFKLALRHLDTPQINALIEEAQKKLDASRE